MRSVKTLVLWLGFCLPVVGKLTAATSQPVLIATSLAERGDRHGTRRWDYAGKRDDRHPCIG
jgi:hypothetical protein